MRAARAYFAVQAVGGAAWWASVFAFPQVREATLGSLDVAAVAVCDIPLFVVASSVAARGVRLAAIVATAWTVVVFVALTIYATVTTEAGWGVIAMAAASGCSVIALCLLLFGRVPTRWIIAGPFAFRPASVNRSPAAHLAATFGQIIVFWGLALVVVPLVLSWLEHRWRVHLPIPAFVGPVGVAVIVLASALGIASAISMAVVGRGTPLPGAMANHLVIAGPYRVVRNPMAIAGIAQGVGVGLVLSSWLVVVYAVLGSLLWNYTIRPLEEADLEERFGEEYRRYEASVRCWVPTRRSRANSGGRSNRRW